MSPVWLNRLVSAVGVVFLGAGVFHGLALIWPNISEPMPWTTHLAFVAINGLMAGVFFFHPPWLPWAYGALTLQQLWQHGGDLIAGLMEKPPRIDWQSVIALGGVAAIWVLVIAWRRSLSAPAATTAAASAPTR